jgi:hypothetical protein
VNDDVQQSQVTEAAYDAAGGSGLSGGAWMLRLTTARWESIPPAPPLKAAATVIGSWLVLAWGRFGFQGIASPRALTRFVLVGVYGWLAVAAVAWLGSVLLARVRDERRPADPVRVLQVTGLSHQPLLVFGVLLQVGQLAPIPGLMTVVAVLTIALWAPAILAAAVLLWRPPRLQPGCGSSSAAVTSWPSSATCSEIRLCD